MAGSQAKAIALLKNIAEERNLQDYEIKLNPVSSGGANYTSVLFAAAITSKNKKDLQCFVKVAAVGENFRNSTTIKAYEVEKFIYTEIKNIFRDLERKHGVSGKDRLKMSEYYGASTVPYEEVLVLEDLASQGFTCHDRMKSVDWDYAAAAITELAKLQALSITMEHEKPDEFAKFNQFAYIDPTNCKDMDVYLDSCKKTALNVVREEHRERFQEFLNTLSMKSFKTWNGHSKCEVFMHADYRSSNLMHRIRDDGSIELIPLDYQTIRGGSPVIDLLYFIFTGTDAAFRAQYYQKLLDHYYSELRAALTRFGLDPDQKYSREDFLAELEEKLPFGLAVSLVTLPVVTVEEQNAPKISEDMEMSDFSITKTSSLFPERLNGIIDDFVRWGII